MFPKLQVLQPSTQTATAPKLSSAGCDPGLPVPPSSGRLKDESCSSVYVTPEIGYEHVRGPSYARDPTIAHEPCPGSPPPCEPHAGVALNTDALCSPCDKRSPQKQPPCMPLQPSEPSLYGVQKLPVDKGPCPVFTATPPRGQCLLHNWTEERATNHLDQVPSMQDGSESYYFRNGHQGLLTLQAPARLSTTQRDSYQHPMRLGQPSKGKREAMTEILLHHQIRKEMQAEEKLTRVQCEMESVMHRDYKRELVQAGPPAPKKPHNYQQEQPETFWLQRASQLPGVSYIRTLDTPFRKNCSFSTPVPLSLGQPLPYESED